MSMTIPVSGMNVASTQLSVTSHNLANNLTDGFKPQTTVTAEGMPAGQNGSGAYISRVRTGTETGVNFNTELPDLKGSEKLYQANAKVLQAENDTLGSLLDIKA